MGRSMQRRGRRSPCARSGRDALPEPEELDELEPDPTPDDFDDSYYGVNAWAPECDVTEADYLEEEDG